METFEALSWLPDRVARDLYDHLHGGAGSHRAAHRRWSAILGVLMTTAVPEPGLDVTVITGMSGAGRSEAADVLEDLGFFVIDNLPPALIGKVAELARGGGRPHRYGLVVDVRSGVFIDDLGAALADLRASGARTRVLFLDAFGRRAGAPVRGNRRRHPLAVTDRVHEGIQKERALLGELKGSADVVLDTSQLNVHELRDRLVDIFSEELSTQSLQVSIVSFGYKHGLPLDVDLVFDCRFLPNPHWIDELRPLDGRDAGGARLRARPARHAGVPRGAAAAVRAHAPGVRARGEVVPLDRGRLHRRPSSQRRDRGGARRVLVELGSDPSVRHRDVDRV